MLWYKVFDIGDMSYWKLPAKAKMDIVHSYNSINSSFIEKWMPDL